MLSPQHTKNQFFTAIQSVLEGRIPFSEVSNILCPYLQNIKESRQKIANFSFRGEAIRRMKRILKATVQPVLNQTYVLLDYLNQHPTIPLQPSEITALKAPFPWGETPEQSKILEEFDRLHPITPIPTRAPALVFTTTNPTANTTSSANHGSLLKLRYTGSQ